MKYSILLAAIDWSWLRPENIFGAQVLERTPAALSLTFIVGFGIVLGLLALTFIDSSDGPTFSFEIGLPREVVRRLAATIANRSIRSWQIVFFCLHLRCSAFKFTGYILPAIIMSSSRQSRTKTSGCGGHQVQRCAAGF